MANSDVFITRIGLVSYVAEGGAVHWEKLAKARTVLLIDAERFQPYAIHLMSKIDCGLQIAKRRDQRQMETLQRLGTYTAGIALDDSGIKGSDKLSTTMSMVVAASCGEHDDSVNAGVLAESENRAYLDVLINKKLITELRQTLFLAEICNLLAGNISIAHKVTGFSRTFMGEEGAGVSTIDTAADCIRFGQSKHLLIGGAF